MLYCADKHKMACFVFTANRCCQRALFLLSAALCCLAHTADLRQEEADDNQKQTSKEHTPKDAPDAEHVCASCCDFVSMVWSTVSSRCSGQRAPSASFLCQLTAVLRSFVVKTTARSPTRKCTQIADRSKDVQVEQATSHLTRPLQSLALTTIDVHGEATQTC